MGERENKREEQGQAERMLVVGIGASAGGLETLKRFFGHLPEKTGTAYVVVMHLGPEQPSILADLVLPVEEMFGHLHRFARCSPALDVDQRETTASALLIAATGYGQEADRARSKESGIDHHLVKPVDTQLIRELLEQAVPDNRLSEVQDGAR
jgi:CheY-like chemotaxis protein